MSTQADSYTAKEIAAHGNRLYQEAIRAQVESEHYGRVLAIDVTSGDYAIGENALTAADLLREKRPEGVVWLMRIGHRALYKIGRPRRSGRA